MYIVLTAMLALNVSSDVLNGFRQVEEGLVRTTENVAVQNESLYDELTCAVVQKDQGTDRLFSE